MCRRCFGCWGSSLVVFEGDDDNVVGFSLMLWVIGDELGVFLFGQSNKAGVVVRYMCLLSNFVSLLGKLFGFGDKFNG